MAQQKLQFVIAGAQKAGTSTLDAILRHHPQIQMASVKETHFFDNETYDWSGTDFSELHALFSVDDDRLRGESTPITLYWRPAIRRLHSYNPNIKLILLLRNPVSRTFAGWRKEFSAGRESLCFADAVRQGRKRMQTEPEIDNLHRYFSYVERSLYGEQISYLLSFFPRENLHCEISEDFFSNRIAVLDRVAAFLDIAPFPADIPDIHLNPGRTFSYPSTLTPEDEAYLESLFRDDIALLESILARSIQQWRRKPDKDRS